MNWFIRKGVFYRPVSPIGWLFLAGVMAYLAWAFVDIDSRSHSASDTLINWFFQVLLAGGVYSIVAFCAERR